MKRIFILLISILFLTDGFSQSVYVDRALSFSSNKYGGTARFVGMGGAFGALGGDFSSLSINPAGLGVYRSSEFVFSPGMSYSNNSSMYINNPMEDDNYAMNLNNLSFVASYDLENTDTRWINANFAVGFNRTNNFNDNVLFEGVNNSSLMEVFVTYARQTTDPDQLDGMYEYLLWQSELLLFDSTAMEFYNEIDDEIYINNPDNFEINQRKIIKGEGSNNELNLAFGGNYADKLYIGASIGINFLNYTEYATHYEYESVNAEVPGVYGFSFIESSKTKGTGLNVKVGAIYKPLDFLRIGAAIQTPTFYDLEEEFYNKAVGYYDDGLTLDAKSPVQNYTYELNTPFRFVGSVGLQIGKIGIIDIDYEYVNYTKMNMDDDDNSQAIIDDNNNINNIFTKTHNLRAGAEFRTGPFYLRAGGGYYMNPYNDGDSGLNSTIVLAGGAGYRVNKFFIDFAYSQSRMSYKMMAYDWLYNTAVANIDNTTNNFIVTMGFKF